MSADLATGARETARLLLPAGGRPAAMGADAAHLAPETMPGWRARLESHWRARLERVTELSLAYHAAEDARAGHAPGAVPARTLLRQAIVERRELAEIEAALTRVGQGWFGQCERCGGVIPAARLTRTPQARYCLSCEAGPDGRLPRAS